MGYSPQGCRVRHHAGTKQQQSTTLHPTEAGDRWAPGICHLWTAADAAKLLQSCPTLSDTTDSSPAGSSVHRILQARILEWVAISFSHLWTKTPKIKRMTGQGELSPLSQTPE